jgi:tetratricopeptide (TPR) repeat protein
MDSDTLPPPTPHFSPTARPPRQPTRTRLTGLILIVFMLMVWFVGPAQLPLFFQRLVGLVNALLAMLVVVFAIREYGKKYNRLRWPLFGRVSSSKVAGSLAFIAVAAWWLSPWAPIPPGQAEPDMWLLLEHGLDDTVLSLSDRDFATIVAPSPSAAARRAATLISAENPPFARALAATAAGQFDVALSLLDGIEKKQAKDRTPLETVRAARAQVEVYSGQFAAASSHYAELLKSEPRREDYLAHGALAAALQADYATAGDRARQLLDQAATRRHEAIRYRQAVNLLVAIRVMQGKYAEAERLGDETKSSRDRAARETDDRGSSDPQLAVDANNMAVIHLLTSPPGTEGLSTGFVSAKTLWIDWNEVNGRPRDLPDAGVAAAEHNLGMVALGNERFEQADDLLSGALAVERESAVQTASSPIGVSLNALAELARIEADFTRAESLSNQADDALQTAASARPAWLATRAALDADLGRFNQAMARYKSAIQLVGAAAPRHPFASVLRIRLGEVELSAGKIEEAESSVREGLAGLDSAGPERLAARAQGFRILGTIELHRDKRDSAGRQFDAAARLLGLPTGGPDEVHTAPPPETLEVAALRAGRTALADSAETYSAAVADCEATLAIVQRVFGERAAQHPLTARYAHDLARLDIRRGKLLAAEPLLRQALAIDERALPKDHPATVSVLDDLADVLDKSGRADEGRAFADEAKQRRADRAAAEKL